MLFLTTYTHTDRKTSYLLNCQLAQYIIHNMLHKFEVMFNFVCKYNIHIFECFFSKYRTTEKNLTFILENSSKKSCFLIHIDSLKTWSLDDLQMVASLIQLIIFTSCLQPLLMSCNCCIESITIFNQELFLWVKM